MRLVVSEHGDVDRISKANFELLDLVSVPQIPPALCLLLVVSES